MLVARKAPIQVKLADFGISKLIDGTELKTQVGTFGYIAPEVFGLLEDTGESSRYTYSSAVDIWSLGCLLYSVLTGHSPFPGSSYLPLGDYVNGRTGFPETPLLERGVSLAGRSFILKLMCPSPNRRPKAAVDLLDDWVIPLTATNPPEQPEIPAANIEPISTPPIEHGNGQTKIKPHPLERRNGYPFSGTGAITTLGPPVAVSFKSDMV